MVDEIGELVQDRPGPEKGDGALEKGVNSERLARRGGYLFERTLGHHADSLVIVSLGLVLEWASDYRQT